MKALTLIAGIILTTSTAFAGITGPVKTEMSVCLGDNTVIAGHKHVTGIAQSSDEILKGFGTLIRAYDSVVINELLNNKLVHVYAWDKTNWFAGAGIDINDVSDYITFVVNGNDVTFIGGGHTEYSTSLALVGKDTSKLPKTSVGQKENKFLNISVKNNGYGQFSLAYNVITGATQKCVKTKLVPNPYFMEGDPESNKLFEMCEVFEQVTPVAIQTVLEQDFSVSTSCSIETDLPL